MTRSAGRQRLADEVVRRVARLQAAAELVVKLLEPRCGDVVERDIGAVTDGHLRGMLAGDAAAQDQHPRRQHARSAAKQQPSPTGGLQEMIGAHIHGHAPGHLTHRGQQRQAPEAIRDRLSRRSRCSLDAIRPLGLPRAVGGQMEISEQRVPRLQPRDLPGLRLLDLDDHLRGLEHRIGVGQDLRANLRVGLVGNADARARAGFYEHDVALPTQSLDDLLRRRSDAELQGLDFLGNADAHDV